MAFTGRALPAMGGSWYRKFQELISYRPFIKKLALAHCKGLNKFDLSGFTKLNNIEVEDWCVAQIQKIKIDLSSLQSFRYNGMISESYIDVTACKNLEELSLTSRTLTDRVCQDLVSKPPCLKSLSLLGSRLKKVKIWSPQLEMLTLAEAEEVVIDAPNLLSFDCIFDRIIPSAFLMEYRSSLRKVNFWLYGFKIDADYLLQVRKRLRYFNQINLLYIMFLPICINVYSFPRYLKDSSIPALLNIEQLSLRITQFRFWDAAALSEKTYNIVVGSLFWMCHPRRLLYSNGDIFHFVEQRVFC